MRNGGFPQASMEPPPFGDGNVLRAIRRSFNGAIGWTYVSRNGIWAHPLLQWSHRLSAMETSVGDFPSRLLHGLLLLQWSHRLSAMETWPPVGYPSGPTPWMLQWSHRLSAMETMVFEGEVACLPGLLLLQWSHRLSAMETARHGFNGATAFPHINIQPWRFNGATAFRRWKGRSRGLPAGASMEPPPFGDGNCPSRTPTSTTE